MQSKVKYSIQTENDQFDPLEYESFQLFLRVITLIQSKAPQFLLKKIKMLIAMDLNLFLYFLFRQSFKFQRVGIFENNWNDG